MKEKRYPLIDEMLSKVKGLNLANSLIISVQHLCTTTEALFDALIRLSLKPENLYVLGKCYSTNPRVLASLRKKGVKALLSSAAFNSDVPFDSDFDKNIEKMLRLANNEKNFRDYERIIVLDDGGHLLKKVLQYLSQDLPIVGIEQTSSGFNRMKKETMTFPVVNLARSWLKLKYESPIIIKLVLRKLKEKLKKINKPIKNILIIGGGVIGQKVYDKLKKQYNVSVFDIKPKKSTIKASDFKKKLSEFDLIIGCTGEVSLSYNDFSYLKNPVVIGSISSSDREFESFKLRKSQLHTNCHANVTTKGITLLNCGFPITFDQDYDSIDTDDFQLTRSLILSSIYQASTTKLDTQGFIPMLDEPQQVILNAFQKLSLHNC